MAALVVESPPQAGGLEPNVAWMSSEVCSGMCRPGTAEQAAAAAGGGAAVALATALGYSIGYRQLLRPFALATHTTPTHQAQDARLAEALAAEGGPSWMGAAQPLAMLNLGGVGNVTWIDPRQPAPESYGALLAFDTGPANAPLNDLMLARTGQPLDPDGATGLRGAVDEGRIAAFLSHPFFHRMPPKSLDRNDFHSSLDMGNLSTEDAAATLAAAVAAAVARGAEHFPVPVTRLLVTGGGRRNARIMAELTARLRVEAEPIEAAGLDGDMLEAQAFAYLAVRVARGLPTSGPATTGVAAMVGGGKVSRPD